ncbi:uncharacterized protein FIBRA_01704 [Fibroporia radiculosa]|uniref:tripeptidyl-peptidase II n=1 Tax=Fibroporia radiculosa TaxID=599839 RepID=J4G149_9APHY|nr:uncharacterized protein FIBRA_01704 [Fibroporia radiculosa]CCL99683.1 predicted protein [Fibroporia radiculosa]
MVLACYLTLTALSALVLGKPLARSLQVHEFQETVPTGYKLVGPASSDKVLSLRIGLVQNNVNGLVDALYNISAPTSVDYGKYLSQAEVNAYMAPTSETVSAVNSWLSENGLNATAISSAGDWLAINVPVSMANDLLGANFSVYLQTRTGEQIVRTLSYSIPTDLNGHIDFVHPTITFAGGSRSSPVVQYIGSADAIRNASPSANVTAACYLENTPVSDPWVFPTCIQALYGIPATPATVTSNYLGVVEYEGNWANRDDLKAFLGEFRPDMNSSTTYAFQSIDNGTDSQNITEAGAEADLDIEYTVGLATGVPVTLISTGGEFPGALLDAAATLLNESSPPQVLSSSWGYNEDQVSKKFAYALCNAYAGLGARGVSIIYSSGDGGVSGNHYPEETCTSFVPQFPSGCPFVTSVGATTGLPTESAASFTSGGFSNYWSRPAYQDTAVTEYLSILGSNNTGLYNASGRGFPDISAYGVNFETIGMGDLLLASGTSCAAPTFASIVALLNDRLLAAGKPVLGFLNPLLYSKGVSGFTDILTGNNLACANYTTGFYATQGWDPLTGLGTPIFPNLQEILGL